jgi:hypothetical protein
MEVRNKMSYTVNVWLTSETLLGGTAEDLLHHKCLGFLMSNIYIKTGTEPYFRRTYLPAE